MLTNQMVKKLNDQLNLEFYSSNLYLQMSAWCDDQNFPSFGKFLRDHASEERQHMERLLSKLKHQKQNINHYLMCLKRHINMNLKLPKR